MSEQQVQAVVHANGSQLLAYEEARYAYLVLPSGEQVLVSIGTAPAKVFVKRPIFSWFFRRRLPRSKSLFGTVVSKANMALRRCCLRLMVLNGLIELVSGCGSVSGLKAAWSILENPIAVAA